MEKVWITEKPSAAKDLAAGMCLAFNVTSRRESNGLITISNGDVILPFAGHLLATARPAHYLSPEHAEIERTYAYDRFHEFLPILVPRLFKVPRTDVVGKKMPGKPKPFAPYTLAARTLRNAKEIVNAGDKDREGQMIVDEMLEHLGIDPYGASPMVWRVGITSNLPNDIADVLRAPKEKNSNNFWRMRCVEAETRQLLDFTWGINLSMVGQAMSGSPRISAGRVQTPVLELIKKRDDAIENFKPAHYFVPVITLSDGSKMRWFKREGSEGAPGFDAQGRIVSQALGLQIVQRIAGGFAGSLSKAIRTQHSEKPPMPFSTGSLLATASKELGMTIDEVSAAAKVLYSKHKAISYIGTDCKFLPTSLHDEAPNILRALSKVFPKLAPGADISIKSAAFNDAELDEHYAIVPTGVLPLTASPEEQSVFRVISKRFIAQFYPDYVYIKHKVEGTFGADHFVSNERQDVRLGWKEVDGQTQGEKSFDAESSQPRDKDQPDDDVVEMQA